MATTRRSFLAGATAGGALAAMQGPALAHSAHPAAPIFAPDPKLAWLVANENPYGPSPRALLAMSEAADQGAYYAFRGVSRLKDMIAERNRVSPSQIVIGSGSGELLNAIALSWGRDGTILCPELFFDLGVLYAERLRASADRIAMLPDMQTDLSAMQAATRDGIAMVQVCNPNNPTGITIPGPELHQFARMVAPKATLLVDEAYNEVADDPDGTSAVPLVREGLDVIVTRTFSKIHGMAGLRVGYAITSEANAARITSALMNGTNSVPGLAAAMASLEDEAFLTFSRNKIVEGREMISDAARRGGLTPLPSQTNFVLLQVPDADALKAEMAKRDIAIRGAYAGWPGYSRVSCGKIEHVARFAHALPEAVEQLGWNA